jgi:hypothetical protein
MIQTRTRPDDAWKCHTVIIVSIHLNLLLVNGGTVADATKTHRHTILFLPFHLNLMRRTSG